MDIETGGWALLAAAVFAAVATAALIGLAIFMWLWWRDRPGTSAARVLPDGDRPDPVAQVLRSGSEPGPIPASEAIHASPLVSAIRTLILQMLGERCPAGWRVLVLTPPEHPRQMIWHLHLKAAVALDLEDGRTVPATPPPIAHEWTLPSGRRVGLASGDPSPPPGPQTRAVRAAGRYLAVEHEPGEPGAFVVRVGVGADARHQYRAPAEQVTRLRPLIEEALKVAVGDGSGQSVEMGYSPTSWMAHERIWLEIVGR